MSIALLVWKHVAVNWTYWGKESGHSQRILEWGLEKAGVSGVGLWGGGEGEVGK